MKIHNTKSAAAETGFCERTMRRYAQKGIGPRFVLVGNRRLYTDEALREWLGAGGAA